MPIGYSLLIGFISFQIFLHAELLDDCRFVRTFYQRHSNVFKLDPNQRSLTVQPFYALPNQSFSVGIIYRLAETYLVPVPLLFQCSDNERIYTPIDCEVTVMDLRSDLSLRATESTRTTTVPLAFADYPSIASHPIRGAYFKQSKIALRNCRLSSDENLRTSNIFYLRIEFEQTIHSPCTHTCLHPQLYQCSSASHTCQCRSGENGIERFGSLCIDTELNSNCSLTPERCRRICRISDQVQRGKADSTCQCPSGSQRILSNNIYRCQCDRSKSSVFCPEDYTCREKLCLIDWIFPTPLILIGLLSGALLLILLLIIGLIKMRSIRCVKFVHSSSTTLTRLSSSTKSTDQICERYTRVNLYE